MNKNDYTAIITDGKDYKQMVDCARLQTNNNFNGTVIMGVPETGSVGYETVLATIPNNFIVTLERNEDTPISRKQFDILEEVFNELLKETTDVITVGGKGLTGLKLTCIPEDKFREVFRRYGVIENINF